MDLWILSQDKRNMCKATFLKIGINCFSEWCVFDNYNELGGYATEKRALEVLGEIQKLLIGNVLAFRNFDAPNDECLKSVGINNAAACHSFTDDSQQVEILHRDCVIYKMPED